jgi:hypothetical protein
LPIWRQGPCTVERVVATHRPTSAPINPQAVQTNRGYKERTGVPSGNKSATLFILWRATLCRLIGVAASRQQDRQ